MTHELKILPKWYADVESGKKNFEIRVNDRDYKVGDTLVLQEYDKDNYTGREITRKIQYIYQGNGAYGLSEEYCILGLEQEQKTEQGKWIEERTYMECPNCHDIWHYEENQTERFKCCPTCGERNEYESKYTRNRI